MSDYTPILERIAVALETLAGTKPVAATPVTPVAQVAPAVVKTPLTLDQLKTVSAPFKSAGQVVLCKEAISEIGATSIAELTTRAQQDRYIAVVKDKAELLPVEQRNAVNAAIATF